MKPPTDHQSPLSPYNAEVQRVYFKVLKEAKALLATIEEEPLRYTLIREENLPIVFNTIVHELVNPLIYLRLASDDETKLGIEFGLEFIPTYGKYYHIGNTFIRMLYKATMANTTSVNIEDSVRTDYIFHECSGAYEQIEERGCRHHSFQLIPFKTKVVKRKLSKVA